MTNENTQNAQESYWDKAGIPLVPLSEALWQIETSLVTGQTRGVWCLISEAGEGKSQSVNALLRKHGRRVVDIRTAQLTHVGAGVPQRAVDGFFDYAVPSDFPHPGEKAAIVFDEVNQGQPFAIALVFKMLEDRGLYGYKLPDDCPVILLMNPGTNAYNVSRIETNPAINRRIKKLYIHNSLRDWRKHAETTEFHSPKDFPDGVGRACHPMVVRYLTSAPSLLYAHLERDGGKQFACPATWQTVSHDLYTLEAVKEPLSSERARNRIAASINTVQADALVEYIKNNEILISPAEVLKKYKRNSKLRERVLAKQTEPGGGYQNLANQVAEELFGQKPDVGDVCDQLALFWADMPVELRSPYFAQVKRASDSTDPKVHNANLEYMKQLTTELMKNPLWARITSSSADTEEAGREELRKGNGAAKALQASAPASR